MSSDSSGTADNGENNPLPRPQTPPPPSWNGGGDPQEPPRWGQRLPPEQNQQPPQNPWGGQPGWNQQPPQNPWGGQPGWNQQPPQNPWGGQPGWNQAGPYGAPGAGFPGPGYVAPPKPGVIPLRPLGLGEMMDGAFQACRRNAAATFGSAILVQVLVALIMMLVLPRLFDTMALLDNPAATDAEYLSASGEILGGSVWLSLASVLAFVVLQGVLTVPVARSILNLHTGLGQAWRLSRRRILPLIAQSVLMLVVAGVALSLFVFLAVVLIEALEGAGIAITVLGVLALMAVFTWISIKLMLAPAALVLEPAGIFASIGRSWVLTRRNWWRTFGIVLLTGLIVSVITSVVTLPITMIVSFVAGASGGGGTGALVTATVISMVISSLFTGIGYAFQGAVTALLYVDLRIRREGFDIVLMKEQESLSGDEPDRIPGRVVPPQGHSPYGQSGTFH